MQPINMDNDFSRDILISAMESILENPSLANMNEQLARLTDIEKLHLKKLIDIQVSIKSLEVDALLNAKPNQTRPAPGFFSPMFYKVPYRYLIKFKPG